MHFKIAFFLLALPFGAKVALAGFISTPSLDAIYSQSAFGATPIIVKWLSPGAALVRPDLASIDDDIELRTLFAMAPENQPVVNAFFVDAVNYCGGRFGPGIVSCGSEPGNILMVASSFAAGANGAIAFGHEVGHNAGLPHFGDDNSSGNLMNIRLNSPLLSSAQANLILASNLVQIAADGSRFITIRPIAVLTSAVPEPDAIFLLLAGLLVVAATARRNTTR